MKHFALPLALLALPACTATTAEEGHGGGHGTHHSPVESIRYETSPCFGACPIYTLSVTSVGHGTYQGQRFTSETGTRTFEATPAQFDAFAKALEPYRGKKGGMPGGDNCKRMHTDDTGVTVTWTYTSGKTDMLAHYYGCDSPEFEAMEAALRDAPSKLPVGELIGKH